ncbi:hypothetical protein HK102_003771, partial [Quaeritorhiza haematococci]
MMEHAHHALPHRLRYYSPPPPSPLPSSPPDSYDSCPCPQPDHHPFPLMTTATTTTNTTTEISTAAWLSKLCDGNARITGSLPLPIGRVGGANVGDGIGKGKIADRRVAPAAERVGDDVVQGCGCASCERVKARGILDQPVTKGPAVDFGGAGSAGIVALRFGEGGLLVAGEDGRWYQWSGDSNHTSGGSREETTGSRDGVPIQPLDPWEKQHGVEGEVAVKGLRDVATGGGEGVAIEHKKDGSRTGVAPPAHAATQKPWKTVVGGFEGKSDVPPIPSPPTCTIHGTTNTSNPHPLSVLSISPLPPQPSASPSTGTACPKDLSTEIPPELKLLRPPSGIPMFPAPPPSSVLYLSLQYPGAHRLRDLVTTTDHACTQCQLSSPETPPILPLPPTPKATPSPGPSSGHPTQPQLSKSWPALALDTAAGQDRPVTSNIPFQHAFVPTRSAFSSIAAKPPSSVRSATPGPNDLEFPPLIIEEDDVGFEDEDDEL